MGTALSARVMANIAASFVNTVDVGSADYPLNYGPTFVFTDGSGALQANKLFTDTRTLAASASEDLDLNGSLTDVFGATFSPTKIKAILIQADATNTNDVVVGGASANQFASLFGAATDKIKLKPGALFLLATPDAAGYAVTASTGDLLKIANGGSGTSVSYTIILIAA